MCFTLSGYSVQILNKSKYRYLPEVYLPGNTYIYTVRNLLAYQDYTFKVKAKNVMGYGAQSYRVSFRTSGDTGM